MYLANSTRHLTRQEARSAPATDPALIGLNDLNRRQFGQLVDILRRKYATADQFTFPDALAEAKYAVSKNRPWDFRGELLKGA